MKDDKVIKASGLRALARIFVSCRPVMGAIMTENQRRLIRCAEAGNDMNFDLFVKGLITPDDTYDKIMEYASSVGGKVIDDGAVYGFFGGDPHFQKISGQIKDLGLPKGFAQKIFFAHILLPMRLDARNGIISGVYENGGVGVVVKNLVPFSMDRGRVADGMTAFVHYATIIALDPDSDMADNLRRAQSLNEEFLTACRYVGSIGGIDYSKFWNLCRWTEETLHDRGL